MRQIPVMPRLPVKHMPPPDVTRSTTPNLPPYIIIYIMTNHALGNIVVGSSKNEYVAWDRCKAPSPGTALWRGDISAS